VTKNEQKKRRRNKRRRRKKKGGENFRNLREGWANEGKKKRHHNIWFDLGSSQNSQNKLIHN
jgi:hypothetical protein